jgi:NAD(P)-dependent dehydrogenase (short-subunit alcohol dehydrogenase family)
VIGVGPERGLGAQLCKRFAADGFKMIVAGRTNSAVEAVAKEISLSGGNAVRVVANAISEAKITALSESPGPDLELGIL